MRGLGCASGHGSCRGPQGPGQNIGGGQAGVQYRYGFADPSCCKRRFKPPKTSKRQRRSNARNAPAGAFLASMGAQKSLRKTNHPPWIQQLRLFRVSKEPTFEAKTVTKLDGKEAGRGGIASSASLRSVPRVRSVLRRAGRTKDIWVFSEGVVETGNRNMGIAAMSSA
jgi:hypothetical protein